MTQELDVKLRRQREHLRSGIKDKEDKIQKLKEILDSEVTPPETEERENRPPTPEQHPQRPRKHPGTPARRQRRSRSAGEVWLEHNSIKPIPLDTVLQPSMKKRKSVTKLS